MISSLSEKDSEADKMGTCGARRDSATAHNQYVSDESGDQLDLLTVVIYPHRMLLQLENKKSYRHTDDYTALAVKIVDSNKFKTSGQRIVRIFKNKDARCTCSNKYVHVSIVAVR